MTHPKKILSRYQIQPKRSLGQNFLVEDALLCRIADLANISPEDHVLEIGPGLGSLTQILASRAGSVVAVEVDGRLMPVLEDELATLGNVRLVHGDILEWQTKELMDAPFKVVANIPYYITGAILRHLLGSTPLPEGMVLTVQKEVGDRITAKPGEMSVLAVSVQLHGLASTEFTIRPGSFWPKPDVDSSVVRFERHQPPLLKEDELAPLMQLVKTGFSNKRKQLQKNLRSVVQDRDRLAASLRSAAIDGARRAQTLSVEEWISLYRSLR